MNRKQTLILLALTASVTSVLVFFGRAALERRASRYVQQLKEEDPQARLDAAEYLLAIDPRNNTARLAKARSLIDTGQYHKAREALDTARHQPLMHEALELTIDSYLNEARTVLATAVPNALDLVEDQLNELLENITRHRQMLETLPRTEALVTTIEAQQISHRAALLYLMLKRWNIELSKAREVAFEKQIEHAGMAVVNIWGQIDELDQQLEALCKRSIALDPTDSAAYELMLQKCQRRGALTEARRWAARIAQQPSLHGALAGRVASGVLDFEKIEGRVNESDLALAQQLLGHAGLTEPNHLELRLANVTLQLRLGQTYAAALLSRQILDDHARHVRATCLLARALIALGETDEAIEQMVKINDWVRSASARYVLGMAYLAADREERGRELLRQALELDPEHLEARLAIATSLVDAGFLAEASSDISTAKQLNPDHATVGMLQTRQMVEMLNSSDLSKPLGPWLDSRGNAMTWQDLALVAAMVLDDVAQVSQYTSQILEQDAGHMLALLGDAWSLVADRKRALVAAVIVRSVLARVDSDPLLRAGSVWSNPVDRRELELTHDVKLSHRAPAVRGNEVLIEARYMDWPEQWALVVVEVGLEHWPDEPALLDLAVRLNLWLNRPDEARLWLKKLGDDTQVPAIVVAMRRYLDGEHEKLDHALQAMSPDIPPTGLWIQLTSRLARNDRQGALNTLEHLLTDHPWAELALLQAIGYDLNEVRQNNALARIDPWLTMARKINPDLARLARARVNLVLGRADDALQDVKSVWQAQDIDSDIRRRAAEVAARVHLSLARPEPAAGIFEALAISIPDVEVQMKLAAADVLIDAGRHRAAAAALVTLIAQMQDQPRWLDQSLARATSVVPAPRLRKLIDTLLVYQPGDPLLTLYKAWCHQHSGDLSGAEKLVQQVLDDIPEAPRALIALAGVAAAQQRIERARRIYQRLVERGGRVATVARRRLEGLDLDTSAGASVNTLGAIWSVDR